MALAEFFVTFREFFEIALIVGVMLAYLQKTGNGKLAKHVYLGAALAAVASIVPVLAFGEFAEVFEQNEAIFEGVTLMLACALVTWLIVWMMQQRSITESLKQGLKAKVEGGQALGIVALSFIAVFREGVEVVLFLGGINISTGALSLGWAIAGAFAAIILVYAMFRSIVQLDLDMFFKVTSALLILLAAGLLSQGVHELEEAGVLPPIIAHIYDVTPAQNSDGTYPI
ncbi:MAG: FTR1 family protein, partial [Candidatus Micrarchaeia archaeon]